MIALPVRALCAVLLALTLLPATALGWGETDTRAVPGGGPVSCLRAAGGGGLLSVLAPLGRSTTAFDLLSTTDSGLSEVGRTQFGELFTCPGVASNDSDTALLAAVEAPGKLRATLVTPGTAPTSALLARLHVISDAPPAVAVGPAGDAAVAWIKYGNFDHRGTQPARLYVARRAPAGGLGRGVLVDTWKSSPGEAGNTKLGIDAAGTTTLVWSRSATHSHTVEASLMTARGRRGKGFGAARVVTHDLSTLDDPALTVMPSGASLLGIAGAGRIAVFERGKGRYSLIYKRADETAYFGSEPPALAEARDGSAVLAWRTNELEPGSGGVVAARRVGHGKFGRPTSLAPAHPPNGSGLSVSYSLISDGPSAPQDDAGGYVRAAMTPDAHPVVTWVGAGSAGRESRTPTAYAALGRSRRGWEPWAKLSSPCRPPNAAAPLSLADGRAAAAWSDSIMTPVFGGAAIPERGGRIHLARQDARRPAPAPPPSVRLNVTGKRILGFGQALHLRVSCDRACDLRAFVPRGARAPTGVGMVSLARAGTSTIPVSAGFNGNVAPKRPRRVRVVLHACATGSPSFAERSVLVRLKRRPVAPPPAPLGVSARRSGRRVVVRWHTARPARNVDFNVLGLRARHSLGEVVENSTRGGGHRRFHMVLKPRRPAGVRWVRVIASAAYPPYATRSAVTRVR
jgi:hypothetical protein